MVPESIRAMPEPPKRRLLVPRHGRQLGHVLKQDSSALQVQNAVLAPELQLAIDAFAAAPTNTPSCSCEMCTSEPKSVDNAHSRRASRTGSGCSMDSSIRSLCQRIRWQSSSMILIAIARLAFEMAEKILAPQHE